MTAPHGNRSEKMVRLLERAAPDGLKTREVADAFGVPSRLACGSLFALAKRGVIARDPQTQRWRVNAGAGDALFYDRDRVGGTVAPMVATAGITAEDLAWMRDKRDRAAARRKDANPMTCKNPRSQS